MSFKDFSTFSFGGHIVEQSRTIWLILVESLIRKNVLNLGQQFRRCQLKFFYF